MSLSLILVTLNTIGIIIILDNKVNKLASKYTIQNQEHNRLRKKYLGVTFITIPEHENIKENNKTDNLIQRNVFRFKEFRCETGIPFFKTNFLIFKGKMRNLMHFRRD